MKFKLFFGNLPIKLVLAKSLFIYYFRAFFLSDVPIEYIGYDLS